MFAVDHQDAPNEALLAARMAFTINDAVAVSGIGRSSLYKLIGAGELPVIKVGSRTLIRRPALEAFLERLERAERGPSKAA